jgi:ribosome-binding protein aMBF1 (putative translation factor)
MLMTLANRLDDSHRVIAKNRRSMAKAGLVKPKNDEKTRDSLRDLGGCLDFARRYLGWTVDQLAAELSRTPQQIGAWIRGEERCQVDAVMCVRQLHGPFVIALAQLRSDEVVIETTIRIKGMAGYK